MADVCLNGCGWIDGETEVDAVFWTPADKDGKADPLGGYFAVAKPAGFFDTHPLGEGNPKIARILRKKAKDVAAINWWEDTEELQPKYTYKFMASIPVLNKDTMAYDAYPELLEIDEEIVALKNGKKVYYTDGIGHVCGKHNGVGQITCHELPDVPPIESFEMVPARYARKRLDMAAKRTPVAGTLTNVYVEDKITTTDVVNTKEYPLLQQKYDTYRNATLNVGAGKPCATITFAFNAASSGDTISAFDALFTETLTWSTKSIQLIGQIAGCGVTVTSAAATRTMSLTGAYIYYISNLTITQTGTATSVIYVGSANAIFELLRLKGGTQSAIDSGAAGIMVRNCLAWDSVIGFLGRVNSSIYIHCLAVDCSTAGFSGISAGKLVTIACIGHNANAGGVDWDANSYDVLCLHNTSGDATAPGADNSVSTFVTTDFNDYAGDDFTLKTSVAGTTAARRQGEAYVAYDIAGNLRKTLQNPNVFFGGPSDADPSGGSSAPTFAGATSLTDNQDGTFTLVFPQATGAGADYYSWAIHTASISSANLDDRTYDCGRCDDTGAATYSVIVGETAGGAAKLTAGTEYYVAVGAWKGTARDTGAVNVNAIVTDPWAGVGSSVTPISATDYPSVQPDSATDIVVCPANCRMLVSVRTVNTDATARTVTIYKVESGGTEAADRSQGTTKTLGIAGVEDDTRIFGPFTLGPGDKVSGDASVAAVVTATPDGLQQNLSA